MLTDLATVGTLGGTLPWRQAPRDGTVLVVVSPYIYGRKCQDSTMVFRLVCDAGFGHDERYSGVV